MILTGQCFAASMRIVASPHIGSTTTIPGYNTIGQQHLNSTRTHRLHVTVRRRIGYTVHLSHWDSTRHYWSTDVTKFEF